MASFFPKKIRTIWLNLVKFEPQRCIGLSSYSTFIPPERKEVTKSIETDHAEIEGRENPEIFSEEYIAPQVMTSWHKNKLCYRLSRMDCLRRRQHIKIPEFYPGSIIGVTYTDQHAPGYYYFIKR